MRYWLSRSIFCLLCSTILPKGLSKNLRAGEAKSFNVSSVEDKLKATYSEAVAEDVNGSQVIFEIPSKPKVGMF